MTPAVRRPAARVLVLDPDDRVLLIRFRSRVSGRAWWLTPGGGVDPGETYEAAAVRELAEECGLHGVVLGPCVWFREHEFTWNGVHYLQQERFFVARVQPFELSRVGWTEEEATVLGEHRWWSVDEMLASADEFAPRRFGPLLQSLLEDGIPSEPIDTGV